MSEKTHGETEVPNSFPQVHSSSKTRVPHRRVRRVSEARIRPREPTITSMPRSRPARHSRQRGTRVRIRFRWNESKSTSSETTRRNGRESTF